MNVFQRKLYALLHSLRLVNHENLSLNCLHSHQEQLRTWWSQQQGSLANEIAKTSDRLTLDESALKRDLNIQLNGNQQVEVSHLITGQKQTINQNNWADLPAEIIPETIRQEPDAKKVFLWFWRVYPELVAKERSQSAHLYPSNKIIPDCSLPSFSTTVSALTEAMFPQGWQCDQEPVRPYILLFTFTPVQEFIKSSRKMLDFWAGSYLLHYLSGWTCWYIAKKYGPDAVITPSLWGQEIIDALMLVDEADFFNQLDFFTGEIHPLYKFNHQDSISLSTAGFPNIITALVPGKEGAAELNQEISRELRRRWTDIGNKVRENIRKKFIGKIDSEDKRKKIWEKVRKELLKNNSSQEDLYLLDLAHWQKQAEWKWRKLWQYQLENTWETYITAVPLGNPEENLTITKTDEKTDQEFSHWQNQQQTIAQAREPIPTESEQQVCSQMNVGTWWGSMQGQVGRLLQAVKNTRTWRIPAAPGERSTISGQFSALHPGMLYNEKYREGAGLPAGSMNFFWWMMAEVYPGLFNGSEKLNAIELTKRMAWLDGGIYQSLGGEAKEREKDDYEKMIRFPNLSSIAAARFAHNNPERVLEYWNELRKLLGTEKYISDENDAKKIFDSEQLKQFRLQVQRPFQVPKTDLALREFSETRKGYNGMMFSSKWLADDMALEKEKREQLRKLIALAHEKCGLKGGSPSDWWVLVLADGDNMGNYVSGRNLQPYENYLQTEIVEQLKQQGEDWQSMLEQTTKRMGPATHVGLNRALLDFSNRLVPYLTEHRFCGRVIYSGGDDVMVMLPLEDLPEYLLSLRAAWCGAEKDPFGDKDIDRDIDGDKDRDGDIDRDRDRDRDGDIDRDRDKDELISFQEQGGYWKPTPNNQKILPNRPLFTMGKGATMSIGIVMAHKSVPLPTVLENIWEAEKERAKKLPGFQREDEETNESDQQPLGWQVKDGLCFRVIYSSGNTLEALMKGDLLEYWWKFMERSLDGDLSSLLYILADKLPQYSQFTESDRLFSKAAEVIIERRDKKIDGEVKNALLDWIDKWEQWCLRANPDYSQPEKKSQQAKNSEGEKEEQRFLGTKPEDLSKLLRFSAFWLNKMEQRRKWQITMNNEQ